MPAEDCQTGTKPGPAPRPQEIRAGEGAGQTRADGRKPDVGQRTRDAVHTRRVTESHDLTLASLDQPTSPRKFNLEMPL